MESVNTQGQYDARLKADLERGEVTPLQFHPALKYFIAIGNNHGWGRSDKSEKQAIAYWDQRRRPDLCRDL